MEERMDKMERMIQDAQKKRKHERDFITPEIERNHLVQRPSRLKAPPSAKKTPGLLSNISEEYGVLHPRQWPSGVSYDSVHYLGDLAALQFFSNKLKIPNDRKWQGHTIKKFGDNVVLVADTVPDDKQVSKIPKFQWPENIHPEGEDIHQYIYTVTGLDRYTSVRLLKMYANKKNNTDSFTSNP